MVGVCGIGIEGVDRDAEDGDEEADVRGMEMDGASSLSDLGFVVKGEDGVRQGVFASRSSDMDVDLDCHLSHSTFRVNSFRAQGYFSFVSIF